MKLKQRTYQQRIFLYFFAAFTIFTITTLSFQYKREKEFRHSQLDNTLNNIAEITHRYIEHNQIRQNQSYRMLDSITYLIPEANTRITVISPEGKVLYDSFVSDYREMENHLHRPEIQKSLYQTTGGSIRKSHTTGQEFYYFAHYYKHYYVRCAVIYDLKIQNFLNNERLLLIFMFSLFIIMCIVLFLVTRKLGEFITKLRDFAVRAGKDEHIDPNIYFPDSEFGDIRRQIVHIYDRLKRAKDDLSAEKEKLFNHLHALNEGIAFFSSSKEKILANSHFIHYINLISERSTISVDAIFENNDFKPLIDQIDTYLQQDISITHRNLPQHEITIEKNEKYYKAKGIVFADKSFEILIEDITRPEKRRLLKQQLTSNIAHELKTPLASIKGYLETIINNPGIPQDKLIYFVGRAFNQSERLNALLNDISLLNNIEDAGDLFEFKEVHLKTLINDVIENLESRMNQKNILVEMHISNEVLVYGNDSLLASIFQNFIENTINYAGTNLTIQIRQYLEDEKYYYFSYSDNGKGIPEEHLGRIFERFYRIDTGRTRETGGTGLGLSIVKNAVQLHKGEISVRNKPEGGLEFLFSLAKHI